MANTKKITDKHLADIYGLSVQTLGNWKRSGDKRLIKRYEVLKSAVTMETSIDAEIIDGAWVLKIIELYKLWEEHGGGIKQLLSHVARLEAQLKDSVHIDQLSDREFIKETLEAIAEWAEYAPHYFQEKHDLNKDRDDVKKAIKLLDRLKEREASK